MNCVVDNLKSACGAVVLYHKGLGEKIETIGTTGTTRGKAHPSQYYGMANTPKEEAWFPWTARQVAKQEGLSQKPLSNDVIKSRNIISIILNYTVGSMAASVVELVRDNLYNMGNSLARVAFVIAAIGSFIIAGIATGLALLGVTDEMDEFTQILGLQGLVLLGRAIIATKDTIKHTAHIFKNLLRFSFSFIGMGHFAANFYEKAEVALLTAPGISKLVDGFSKMEARVKEVDLTALIDLN